MRNSIDLVWCYRAETCNG